MALYKAEGILLKQFPWSESSRTVVFFTDRFGKLALVDRGGRSFKSKRGRLAPFTRTELTFYNSEKQTRGSLSAADAIAAWSFSGEGDMGRLAFASAACELGLALLPEEEPHEELYAYLCRYLSALDTAPRSGLGGLFIAYVLRFMSMLGYHASLTFCATCQSPLSPVDGLRFGPAAGGLIDATCQGTQDRYIRLTANEAAALMRLQSTSLEDAVGVLLTFAEITRLTDCLTRFLQFHADLTTELQSIRWLDKLKAAQPTGPS